MANLALLLVCLLLGAALRYWRVVPADTHLTINQLLVTVFIPALILLYIPDIHLTRAFWLPVLIPWLVFLGGLLFFSLVAKLGGLSGPIPDARTLGTLQLTGGISSISFVGFPVFELLYGKAGLAIGLMMSQAGTFLVVMTLGVVVASWHTTQHPSARILMGNMVRFLPFPVFVVALVANLAGYRHPALVHDVLERVSSPFSVLAMLTVGLQLRLRVEPGQRSSLTLGLFYKLILAPLLVLGVLRLWLGRQDYVADLCILGAAIGPMNTTAVLVSRYKLNSVLASQMIGIGIPLSLPVLFLLYHFLH
ncbi:AEC family transporter [Spirosoma spitsbergense]|uniref:AEC family transporter n=1 Tax=Spirosoma spitsbergense TaxID=431554 RepID=UPI00037E1A84|nr:hypothetical protein [Spirosoma spitsbergense]